MFMIFLMNFLNTDLIPVVDLEKLQYINQQVVYTFWYLIPNHFM